MNTVTIYLPDEFRLLCILLGVDPKELLQSFADAVTIPSEHFQSDVLSSLATNFFVDYVREEGVNAKAYSPEQKAFLKKKENQSNLKKEQ